MRVAKSFAVGCAAAALLLGVGHVLLGQPRPVSRDAMLILIVTGIVVVITNTPQGRVGKAAANGCAYFYFTYVFFVMAHSLDLSSFDPTPSYGLAMLAVSIAGAAVTYLLTVPSRRHR
jgi:hypothetical protein